MNAHSHAARNDAVPRDLRMGDADSAGAGKFYDVEPEAFETFKRILAEKDAALVRPVKGAAMKGNVNSVVDLSIYPAEVVAAAKVEAAKPDKRARRYGDVFTPEVVAIWQEWKEKDGRSPGWIGKNNGLLEVPDTVVHTYMFKHKQAAAAIRSQKGRETAVPSVGQTAEPVEVREETPVVEMPMVEETAVADVVEEDPVVEEAAVVEPPALDEVAATDAQQPLQAIEPLVPTRPDNLPAYLDREYRPVPRVGDTLGNLIRLLNDERVTIEGEVDLRLNIKFGGK